MKTAVLVLSVLLSAPHAFAKDYTIDPAHSNITFTIRHMFSKVTGSFSDFEGAFKFDEKQPEKSTGKLTIKTTSINTQNTKRDEHLRSADFFDVAKYPTMVYEAAKITGKGKNKFKIDGKLTMHGVTKDVSMDGEYLGTDKDPWGNQKAGFTATGKLNRKDFGLKWNKVLESGNVMVGDEVEINIQIEAEEAAAAAKK